MTGTARRSTVVSLASLGTADRRRGSKVAMKLSMTLNYSGDPVQAAQTAADYERAGVDLIWVAELYSFDAVSILGYLAAKTERMQLASGILNIYSRTPALIAGTAAGLDAVSQGRFVLGLGASGPAGHRGLARRARTTSRSPAPARSSTSAASCGSASGSSYDGKAYTLPLPEDQGTGLGKPLKLINRPVREEIPILIASLGHKNVEMTAELANGWLPVFFHPEKARDVWGDDLDAGMAKRSADLGPLEIVAGGTVAITDDKAAAKAIRDFGRPMTALYVGGMGVEGQELLQQRLPALRLRGGGRQDPGPLPRRQEGRGRRARARRLPERHRHGRRRGLRQGADRGLPRRRRHPPVDHAGGRRPPRHSSRRSRPGPSEPAVT